MDVPFKGKRALESNSTNSKCPGRLRTSLGPSTRDLFMYIITAGPGPPAQFWMSSRVNDRSASPLLLSRNLIKMDIWGSLKGEELPLRDVEVRVVRRTLGGSITSSPRMWFL